MAKPIIKIDSLTSGYNGTPVLEDISLEIYPHEIMTILGTSGCGKTTLLKHLIGLLKPWQGSIELFGQPIINMDEAEFNQLLTQVGVLFQNGALLNSIPLSENIAIPLEQHSRLTDDLIEHMVRLKLRLVGLEHAYHLLPSELSGGMRKRAALARAIALDPQLLFADEPGAGLDPVTAASLDRLLLSLKDMLGMTLIIVTHEVVSIKRISDRITYLEKGKILFTGPLEEALESDLPQLRDFFEAQ